MRGDVLRPGDGEYDPARLLYNTRFDDIRPQAVVRCSTVDDVRECVAFAQKHRVHIAVKAGGHSYVGASTGPGLVIDLARLRSVVAGPDTVAAGGGARLIDVYTAVAARGRGIAAGSCPTVGIAGLTLGGGVGVLSRAWGLTCDALVSAEVVTADGQLRSCDASLEPDLFWALHGGGGASFGVVTSMTLRTRPVERLSLAFLAWPWASAQRVIRGWQRWILQAPDETWSNLHLEGSGGGPNAIRVHAVHLGAQGDLSAAVDALARAVGSPPSVRAIREADFLEAMLIEAGCSGRTPDQCRLVPQGELERETYLASSAVLSFPMGDSAIATAVEEMERLGVFTRAGSGAVIVDALGGAVGRVRRDATAFPHRGAFGIAQVIASWGAGAPRPVVDASTAWHQAYTTAMRASTSGALYVNYPTDDLVDPRQGYFDLNYGRLQRVKAKYDPTDLFSHSQSVRLP